VGAMMAPRKHVRAPLRDKFRPRSTAKALRNGGGVHGWSFPNGVPRLHVPGCDVPMQGCTDGPHPGARAFGGGAARFFSGQKVNGQELQHFGVFPSYRLFWVECKILQDSEKYSPKHNTPDSPD